MVVKSLGEFLTSEVKMNSKREPMNLVIMKRACVEPGDAGGGGG